MDEGVEDKNWQLAEINGWFFAADTAAAAATTLPVIRWLSQFLPLAVCSTMAKSKPRTSHEKRAFIVLPFLARSQLFSLAGCCLQNAFFPSILPQCVELISKPDQTLADAWTYV